jgi:hypothetical protein
MFKWNFTASVQRCTLAWLKQLQPKLVCCVGQSSWLAAALFVQVHCLLPTEQGDLQHAVVAI